MEKISRIVPPSQRISTDSPWKELGGIPSNPEPSAGRNVLKSSKDLALKAHRELTGWRAKEARQSEIAERVQQGFFAPQEVETAPVLIEAPQTSTESFLQGPVQLQMGAPFSYDEEIDNYIGEVMREAEAFRSQHAEEAAMEDWSSYPKGSFLDLEV